MDNYVIQHFRIAFGNRIMKQINKILAIDIKDADISIVLSKKNLKESVSKEVTPIQLVKLLPVLKESLSNAIAIERIITPNKPNQLLAKIALK